MGCFRHSEISKYSFKWLMKLFIMKCPYNMHVFCFQLPQLTRSACGCRKVTDQTRVQFLAVLQVKFLPSWSNVGVQVQMIDLHSKVKSTCNIFCPSGTSSNHRVTFNTSWKWRGPVIICLFTYTMVKTLGSHSNITVYTWCVTKKTREKGTFFTGRRVTRVTH